MQKSSSDISKIGIFWLCFEDNHWRIFHSVSYTINLGQTYGGFTIAGESHDPIWESLKRHRIIPGKSVYTDLPRGRVAYSTTENRYWVYTGKWINKAIKQVLKTEFCLDSATQWIEDLHYNDFKKLHFG
jgi:hypothetical protein